MWYTQANVSRARTALTRAVRLAGDSGDREAEVHADLVFAHVEHASGNEDAARERFARSVEGFRELAIPWGTGNALSGMALAVLSTGDADEAERLLDEATAELRHAGPWFSSLALCVRAILAVRRRKPDEAIAYVRESLIDIQDLHDAFAYVNLLVPLSAAAVLKGEDAWAARILGARNAVTERTGAAVVDNSRGDLVEEADREVRARLGPDRWNRAYATGREASIDSLLDDIDRHLANARTGSLRTPRGRVNLDAEPHRP